MNSMETTELSASESLFFYITKILIYKTVSSPFRITHLLLQSKNVLIEQHNNNNINLSHSNSSSKISALKSWFWGDNHDINNKNNTPKIDNNNTMINHLKKLNLSHLFILPSNSVYSSSTIFNFLLNIIRDDNYGLSYLFSGNLYSIFRSFILHRSCSISYDSKLLQKHSEKYLNNSYNRGWFLWSITTSCIWFSCLLYVYPFDNISIHYLFNFNKKYKIPKLKLHKIYNLYSGYLISIYYSLIHSIIYYKLTDIMNMFSKMDDKSDLFGGIFIKYICMGITNIICYPLNTIQKRQMITHETVTNSFYNIINCDNGFGYNNLFNGLYIYLLKQLISQICIDGCDYIIFWYKNTYKTRKINEMKKKSLANIIDNNKLNLNLNIICNICFENKKEYVFNCGHTVCKECKRKLINTTKNCHICRARINSVQKMYI